MQLRRGRVACVVTRGKKLSTGFERHERDGVESSTLDRVDTNVNERTRCFGSRCGPTRRATLGTLVRLHGGTDGRLSGVRESVLLECVACMRARPSGMLSERSDSFAPFCAPSLASVTAPNAGRSDRGLRCSNRCPGLRRVPPGQGGHEQERARTCGAIRMHACMCSARPGSS